MVISSESDQSFLESTLGLSQLALGPWPVGLSQSALGPRPVGLSKTASRPSALGLGKTATRPQSVGLSQSALGLDLSKTTPWPQLVDLDNLPSSAPVATL